MAEEIKFGYALSSEEHSPSDLVRWAGQAEETGFDFALISDHYHPWTDRQGQSAFVWGVLGGIAHATRRILVGTGVTCPTMRMHPAIIAQAAATIACMMPGRFVLGLGTGENLNEHVIGRHWPPSAVRREMLAEAIEIIEKLWDNGWLTHYGDHFTVENARIYSLPEQRPPIWLAVGGGRTAETAGRVADGFIAVTPDRELVERFENAGGRGKPRVGQVKVCWAKSEAAARRTAREYWPNITLSGGVGAELPLPQHFEQAVESVTEEDVAEKIVCGPDPQRHIEAIRKFADAGFDHVYIHQVGPDQEGFFQFYHREVLPHFLRHGRRRRTA